MADVVPLNGASSVYAVEDLEGLLGRLKEGKIRAMLISWEDKDVGMRSFTLGSYEAVAYCLLRADEVYRNKTFRDGADDSC